MSSRPTAVLGTGQTHHRAVVIGVHEPLQQPGLEVVDLLTRIAQPRDGDHGLADAQPRTNRQCEQIHPAGGDVLAELPGLHRMSRLTQRVEELAVDEVHLPQVRL